MAKKKKKKKSGRSLKGSFKTKKAANRRTYTSVRSGSPVTKAVKRACALVQSGPKQGKLRKGCRLTGHGARCDVLTKIPRTARERVGTRKNGQPKYRTVDC